MSRGCAARQRCLLSGRRGSRLQRLSARAPAQSSALTRHPRPRLCPQIIGPCSSRRCAQQQASQVWAAVGRCRQATDPRAFTPAQPTTRATAPPLHVRARSARPQPGACGPRRRPGRQGTDRPQNLLATRLTPPPVLSRLLTRRGLHRLRAPHRRCRQEPGASGGLDALSSCALGALWCPNCCTPAAAPSCERPLRDTDRPLSALIIRWR